MSQRNFSEVDYLRSVAFSFAEYRTNQGGNTPPDTTKGLHLFEGMRGAAIGRNLQGPRHLGSGLKAERRDAMLSIDEPAISVRGRLLAPLGRSSRREAFDDDATVLNGIRLLCPRKFNDERGFFAETYNRQTLCRLGIDIDFVQDNHSLSREPGTVRGLHYQLPPFAQAKLVRVVRGRVLDIMVDIRRNSPTFGRHFRTELSADNFRQILIPIGFAHGFCTLEPNSEILYKVSNYYSAAHDRGILWNDPELGIEWPVAEAHAIVSDKDRQQPRLREAGELLD
jgi:dTDP-4-dehydrorhamnose 3,5-epimerase